MSVGMFSLLAVGIVGVGVGLFAVVRRNLRAAMGSAGAGLLTAMLAIFVHGAGLMAAFDAISEVPADAKQRVLANGIHQATLALPVGMALAMACVVLSSVAWWRVRRVEASDPESA